MDTDRDTIYSLLRDKIPRIDSYAGIEVQSREKSMGYVEPRPGLACDEIDPDTRKVTRGQIFVRQELLLRLHHMADALQAVDSGYCLQVLHGFRPIEVQQKLYAHLAEVFLKSSHQGGEEVHHYIADPQVAGHPRGAAVDVQILYHGKPLDFGTAPWSFEQDALTFSPFISVEAWKNRQWLRSLMVASGFAPYDGEWWHFSYGDQEWAYFARQNVALFDIFPTEEIKNLK